MWKILTILLVTATTVATSFLSKLGENAVTFWSFTSKDLGRNYFLQSVQWTNKPRFAEAK